jgi:hypothetical protein
MRPSISSAVRPVAGGSIAAILAKFSSTKGRYRIRRRIGRNDQEETRYESRVFDGRIIHSAEIERIHKEVLDFERIEAISDPMRELIEDLWPELVTKLPPKRPHS